MSFVDRLAAAFLWICASLFVAALVHLISVMIMPDLAPATAYKRMTALAPVGTFTLLPRPQPGREPVPFEDPALVQGVCLFDLSRGPLRIHADVVDDGLLAISFRTRGGRVFYSMTDHAALRGKIEVVLLTPAQREAVEADDDDEEPTQDLRLTAPTATGFVLIDALAERPSDRARAEARARAVTCKLEPTSN